MVLHLKKILNPRFPKDALCQIWLKLAKWFWRRKFLNNVNVFLLFKLSPLGKGWPIFEQTWIPIKCAKFG